MGPPRHQTGQLLVSDDREVKLIDFNLAQRTAGILGKLFGKSKVQGTQSYISPEQIRGKPLDARADIYSFGCVVYELIHGKPPFTASSSNELLNKHIRTKPPSLLVSNSNIEPRFAELVQQMMCKDPAGRPDSLNEFVELLSSMRVFRVPPAIPELDPEQVGDTKPEL